MSDLHEATSAVISFLDEEADNRSAAGSDMSDYAREPRDLAERLGGALEAAEAMVTALLAERGRLAAERDDYRERLYDVVMIDAEEWALNGGGPGIQQRRERAWIRAQEPFEP